MTITDAVARHAAQRPDHVAVRSGAEVLSYRELDERADQLARHLVARGVRPGRPVGVHLSRSVLSIVALVAVLKAGASYLALDRRHPADLIARMLDAAGAGPVLTEPSLLPDLPTGIETIMLDSLEPGTALDVDVRPQHTAYVAYTSGTTGQPKPVAVPHHAVTSLVLGHDFADLGPDDTVLQLAPVAFDASTWEIWGALLNGATLVLAPSGLTPSNLAALVRDEHVTALWLTAGLFHQVVDAGLEHLTGLRHLLAGGDVLSARHVNRAVSALPATRVVNGYGPTENTTFTCCHHVTEPVDASVPIGRAVAGRRAYVLDDALAPAETGELYAAGDGVAHGYLGAAAATAERFLPDPFSETPGARMYRTGDLVRRRDDGVLEFLGRADRQVKLRGFRVELSAVEAALAELPEVADQVVFAADDRLIAVVVPNGREASPLDLRRRLGLTLPEYAVPSLLTLVDALPLTANGKVDRTALEAAGKPRPTDLSSDYREPDGPVERAVADLWSDRLGIVGIGADDEFFELGGHSLLGVQIIEDLHRAYGVQVGPREFYLAPTPAGLAAALTAGA